MTDNKNSVPQNVICQDGALKKNMNPPSTTGRPPAPKAQVAPPPKAQTPTPQPKQ
jgi:hypothetical protein